MVSTAQLTEVMGLFLYNIYQKSSMAEFSKYTELAKKQTEG